MRAHGLFGDEGLWNSRRSGCSFSGIHAHRKDRPNRQRRVQSLHRRPRGGPAGAGLPRRRRGRSYAPEAGHVPPAIPTASVYRSPTGLAKHTRWSFSVAADEMAVSTRRLLAAARTRHRRASDRLPGRPEQPGLPPRLRRTGGHGPDTVAKQYFAIPLKIRAIAWAPNFARSQFLARRTLPCCRRRLRWKREARCASLRVRAGRAPASDWRHRRRRYTAGRGTARDAQGDRPRRTSADAAGPAASEACFSINA